jgi:hypothetical protein
MTKQEAGQVIFREIGDYLEERGFAVTNAMYPKDKSVIGISLRMCFYIKKGAFDEKLLSKLPFKVILDYDVIFDSTT